jgi:hypothetical protein
MAFVDFGAPWPILLAGTGTELRTLVDRSASPALKPEHYQIWTDITEPAMDEGSSHSTTQVAEDDPDPHPLATLHLGNFIAASKQLGQNWFRGDVELKEIVHLKRPPGSDVSNTQKPARLEA